MTRKRYSQLAANNTNTPSLIIKEQSDTAHLVAYYRGLEHDRKHPRFRDPYAKLLAGEKGADLFKKLPTSKQEQWGTILRTCIFDEIIQKIIQKENIDTVLNMGAGLDSRPYRLPLPPTLHWFEIDSADIFTYKQTILQHESPMCHLHQQTVDVTDRNMLHITLQNINAQATKALVITEGLLAYLAPKHVHTIATELQRAIAFQWWLTEFASPSILIEEQQKQAHITAKSVQYQFATPGGIDYFYSYGWEMQEFRHVIQEAITFKIPPLCYYAWPLKLLLALFPQHIEQVFQKSDGFVLLSKAKPNE